VHVCLCVCVCRASLDDELQSHVSDAFPDARYAVYGSEGAQGVKTLTACISSAKFNPSNFWNGRWRSVWTVTLSADQTTWAVEGTFKVREPHRLSSVEPCGTAGITLPEMLSSRHAIAGRLRAL
jgi:hypothetical protein